MQAEPETAVYLFSNPDSPLNDHFVQGSVSYFVFKGQLTRKTKDPIFTNPETTFVLFTKQKTKDQKGYYALGEARVISQVAQRINANDVKSAPAWLLLVQETRYTTQINDWLSIAFGKRYVKKADIFEATQYFPHCGNWLQEGIIRVHRLENEVENEVEIGETDENEEGFEEM